MTPLKQSGVRSKGAGAKLLQPNCFQRYRATGQTVQLMDQYHCTMYSMACHVQSSAPNSCQSQRLEASHSYNLSVPASAAVSAPMDPKWHVQPHSSQDCERSAGKNPPDQYHANHHKSQGHSQYSPKSRWHCVSRHVAWVLLWSVGTSPESLLYYVGSPCQALANST